MNIPVYYDCSRCEGKFPNKDYKHALGLCNDCAAAQKEPSCNEGVRLPQSLTAENGAKGLLIGEFFETTFIENPEYCGCGKCDYCHDNPPDNGEMIEIKVTVSWTTIKDIYAKIVENMAL